MLSYAFQILKEQGYKNIETENFDNTAELFAAILIKGVSLQVKRGLNQEYIAKTEPLSTIRGKVDITESIKGQTLLKKQLVCSYDEFSVNSYFNRIVKSTMELLLRADTPAPVKIAILISPSLISIVRIVTLYARLCQ